MIVIRELSLRNITIQLLSLRRTFTLLRPPALSNVASPTPSLPYLHSMASAADHAPDPNRKGPPAEPRPSSSVLLISPQNQILLLQRVIRERDHFGGGHVFPGGNVAANQDGSVPAPSQPGRHEDSNVYRLAACRETFEESGILLARKKKGKGLLQISEAEREIARHKM